MRKFCLLTTSYVATSYSHSSCNSSIKGCKYTSISFLGAVGLGISNKNMKNGCFMHIHCGKLYEMRTIGHVLWAIDLLLHGLKPSLANLSLTLRCSDAKVGFKESNLFQDKESIGCLIKSLVVQP